MSVTICIMFVRKCVMEATAMIAASIVGFCVYYTFCVSLYGFYSLAIIFMGQGRESWLFCFVFLPVVLCFITVAWVDLQFVIVGHTRLYLIIPACFSFISEYILTCSKQFGTLWYAF